jgi:hypothetical protein
MNSGILSSPGIVDRNYTGIYRARHVNLSVFFDSCLSSEQDQLSIGDRLPSDNRHGIKSIREGDNKLFCRSSGHR